MTDNNLLDVEDKEHRVSACLTLSYFHLPSHLKRCFTICSLLFSETNVWTQSQLTSPPGVALAATSSSAFSTHSNVDPVSSQSLHLLPQEAPSLSPPLSRSRSLTAPQPPPKSLDFPSQSTQIFIVAQAAHHEPSTPPQICTRNSLRRLRN
jgi:hypothetical protein